MDVHRDGYTWAGAYIDPDSFVTAGGTDTIERWDMSGARPNEDIKLRGPNALRVTDLVASRDGVIAAAVRDFNGDDATGGAIVFIDGESGDPISTFRLRGEAFSPDGNVLAAGTVAGEVALMEAGTGEPIGDRLPEQRDWVNSLAFDPEGTSLLAASDDGSILVLPSVAWTDDVELLAVHLCAAGGRNLTEAEWNDLIQFVPYRPTC